MRRHLAWSAHPDEGPPVCPLKVPLTDTLLSSTDQHRRPAAAPFWRIRFPPEEGRKVPFHVCLWATSWRADGHGPFNGVTRPGAGASISAGESGNCRMRLGHGLPAPRRRR